MNRLGLRITRIASYSPRSCYLYHSLPRPLYGSCTLQYSAITLHQPCRRTYVARKEPEADVSGKETPTPDNVKEEQDRSTSPFYFETGYALFAKRHSRAFPPPFISMPSSSFSDPLSTHNRARNRQQPEFEGEMIRGITNGDDAVLGSPRLIAANDGVGAWAQKEKGHAALWSRLIIHFWALEAEKDNFGASSEPDINGYLQRSFDTVNQVLTDPNEWFGTTTASGALISSSGDAHNPKPLLYVTQLGDSKILVIRPRTSETIFETEEQWHWFDCPRQLGTNSPDTPDKEGKVDKFDIEENDIVLAITDGVVDNLWTHEIVTNVVENVKKQEQKLGSEASSDDYKEGMKFIAEELVKAAKVIAQDPYAESPFMERGVEEGLPMEGGKLDDISVVAAICVRRQANVDKDKDKDKES